MTKHIDIITVFDFNMKLYGVFITTNYYCPTFY